MIEFNATFLVAMLSFSVFIFIMNAIFYKPILNIIRKRDEYINSNYEKAKNFKDKATSLDNIRIEKIQETHVLCRHEINEIVENSQSLANEKVQSVKDEVNAQIQSKKDSLNQEEEKLHEVVDSKVVDNLASSIASKLLGTRL